MLDPFHRTELQRHRGSEVICRRPHSDLVVEPRLALLAMGMRSQFQDESNSHLVPFDPLWAPKYLVLTHLSSLLVTPGEEG